MTQPFRIIGIKTTSRKTEKRTKEQEAKTGRVVEIICLFVGGKENEKRFKVWCTIYFFIMNEVRNFK